VFRALSITTGAATEEIERASATVSANQGYRFWYQSKARMPLPIRILSALSSAVKERRKSGKCLFIPESQFPVLREGVLRAVKIYFCEIRANPVLKIYVKFLECLNPQNALLNQFSL